MIITIMVLDFRPPTQPTLAALLPLWPAALSYAVSYLFIAIIWVNHHHLLRFTEHVTPRLIWVNFAHLFMVSLAPFSTAWVADTRLAAVPVFVYAAVFMLVNLAFRAFERERWLSRKSRGFLPGCAGSQERSPLHARPLGREQFGKEPTQRGAHFLCPCETHGGRA